MSIKKYLLHSSTIIVFQLAGLSSIFAQSKYDPHAYQHWSEERERKASRERAEKGYNHNKKEPGSFPNGSTSKTKSNAEIEHEKVKEYDKNLAIYHTERKAMIDRLQAQPLFCTSCNKNSDISGLHSFIKNIEYLLSMDDDSYQKILNFASANVAIEHLRQLKEDETILLLNSMERALKFYNLTDRISALNTSRKIALQELSRVHKKRGGYGFVDRTGKLIIPVKYDTCSMEFNDGLAWFKKDKKIGFINESGRIVIPFIYDAAESFSSGEAHVEQSGENFTLSTNGTRLKITKFDHMEPIQDGLIRVWKYKKYGFIDMAGELIIPLKYDNASNFNEDLAFVQNNIEGKAHIGFIDKQGKVVIPLEYSDGVSFHEGLAALKKNGKWGYLDKAGKIAIPFMYTDANSFKNGLAVVEMNHETFTINKKGLRSLFAEPGGETSNEKSTRTTNGDRVIGDYEQIEPISNGLSCVRKSNKYGFINSSGELIIPLKYDYASSFNEDLAFVQTNMEGKAYIGFIDKQGKVVIPLEYSDGVSFHEGLAALKKNGKWGYVDKAGKNIIPFIYTDANSFKDGLAVVKLNDQTFSIDRNGIRK